jgi:hypothetical protein
MWQAEIDEVERSDMLASGSNAIEIQELYSTGMQTLDQNRQNSFGQFIAHRRFVFAFSPQTGGIQRQSMCGLDSPRIIGPAIGWREPIYPENLTRPNGEKGCHPTTGRRDLKRNMTLPHKIEMIGDVILMTDEFSGPKANILRTSTC